MIYIGVDPGGVKTGVAVYENGAFVLWLETDDPVAVVDVIFAYKRKGRITVILEDFLGSGRLNRYRKRTIAVLGYVQFTCRGAQIPCELVPQQKRLSNVANVPPPIRGKDEVAAAAHVLSYLERTP